MKKNLRNLMIDIIIMKKRITKIFIPKQKMFYKVIAIFLSISLVFGITNGISIADSNPASDFNYSINNGEVTITGYIGTSEDVVIPSTIEGLPVTRIGYRAFGYSYWYPRNYFLPDSVIVIEREAFNSSNIISILLSKNLKEIGESAFSSSNLREINLPESLEKIGRSAFSGCFIKTINIPNNVTIIESNTFNGCSLEDLYIPDNVLEIGDSAFANSSLKSITIGKNLENLYFPWAFSSCLNLTEIKISPENKNFKSINNVVYNKSGEKLIYYPMGIIGDFVIPKNVTEIGNHSFSNAQGLTGVIIPFGINSIPARIFENCINLRSVEIPNSVTSIGTGAFYGCTKLVDINIPSSVRNIESNVFAYCSSLKNIEIPDSVLSMGWGIFYGCNSLKSVKIGKGIEEIREYIFYDCISLESVDFGNNLKTIGRNAFRNCRNLRDIKLPDSLEIINENAFHSCDKLESVDFGDNLKIIGAYAFFSCSSLSNVVLPFNLEIIENSAFAGCSNMKSIIIPENVTQIHAGVFSNTALEHIIIPKKVNSLGSNIGFLTSIYSHSFTNSEFLKNIEVHPENSSFKSIDGVVYSKDNSILLIYPAGNKRKHYDISYGTTIIYDQSFISSQNLETVGIPETVLDIYNSAFASSLLLQSISIPESVTTIGHQAFSNCPRLQNVVIASSVTHFRRNQISGAEQQFMSSPRVTIYGESASEAEAFASRNNIPFKTFDFLGDNILAEADEYLLAVRDEKTGLGIPGVLVEMEGLPERETNSYGLVSYSEITTATTLQVSVSKAGYRSKELTLSVENGHVGNVFIGEADDKPYIKSLSVMVEGRHRDILNGAVNIVEELDDEKYTLYNISLTADFAGKTPKSIRLYQKDEIIYSSTINSNSLQFQVALANKLTPGARVYMELEAQDGTKSGKIRTGILIFSSKIKNGGQEQSSFKIGGDELINLTLAEDMIGFGNLNLNMNFPTLPVSVEYFEDGKIKIAVGYDTNKSSWEDIEQDFYKYSKAAELGQGFKGADSFLDGWALPKAEKSFGVEASGYGEGYFNAYGQTIIQVGFIFKVKGSFNQVAQSAIGYVPVFLDFEVGAKGEIEVTLRFVLQSGSDTQISFPNSELQLMLYASLTGGAGIAKVLNIGGRGKIELYYLNNFTQKYTRVWAEGSASIVATALMFEAEWVLLHKEWLIYENYRNGMYAQSSEDFTLQTLKTDMITSILDMSSYRPMSRSYLTYSPPSTRLGVFDNSPAKTVKESVFPLAAPKLAEVGADTYLFWLDDNPVRSAENRTVLMYAYSSDLINWSTPAAVDEDGTADFNFSLSVDGTDIYVAWQDLNTQLPAGASLQETAAASEISVARIETQNQHHTTKTTLTTDLTVDFVPSIHVSAGAGIVTWLRNDANDLFGLEGETVIRYSRLDEGNWSDPETIETSPAHLPVSADAGYLDGEFVIAYVLDLDKSYLTLTDRELYGYIPGQSSVKLTDDEEKDSNPVFSVIDGTPRMYWHAGNDIYQTDSFGQPPILVIEDIPDRFEIITGLDNPGIIWLGSVKDDATGERDIYAADILQSGVSERYILKEDLKAADLPNGYRNQQGGWVITYLEQQDIEHLNIRNLKVEAIDPITDICVLGAEYNRTSVVPGENLELSVLVSNTGAKNIDRSTVRIYDGFTLLQEVDLEDMGLGVGEQNAYVIPFSVPESLAQETEYRIEVTVQEDAIPGNNTTTFRLGYSELVVSAGQILNLENYYTQVMVRNISNFSTMATLIISKDPAGNEILYRQELGLIRGRQGKNVLINTDAISSAYNQDIFYILVESSNPQEYTVQSRTSVNLYGLTQSKGVLYGTGNLKSREIDPETRTITASGMSDYTKALELFWGEGETWELYKDKGLTQRINDKTIRVLNPGENTFYIKMQTQNKLTVIWHLKIHKPEFQVEVTGTNRYMQTLSANISGTVPEEVEVSYQWLRNGQIIHGATEFEYQINEADIHNKLTVRIQYQLEYLLETTSTEIEPMKLEGGAESLPATVLNKWAYGISVESVPGYEYKLEGRTWQTGSVFSGLQANTTYTIYKREAETNIRYAGRESLPITVKTNPDRITSHEYVISEQLRRISRIREKTVLSEFFDKIQQSEFTEVHKGEQVLQNPVARVGTGMVVHLKDGNISRQILTLVVAGDVTGSGSITISDYLMMKKHLLGQVALEDEYRAAADLDSSGEITIVDLAKIKSHLLLISKIGFETQ